MSVVEPRLTQGTDLSRVTVEECRIQANHCLEEFRKLFGSPGRFRVAEARGVLAGHGGGGETPALRPPFVSDCGVVYARGRGSDPTTLAATRRRGRSSHIYPPPVLR